jgi:hypothetical protein
LRGGTEENTRNLNIIASVPEGIQIEHPPNTSPESYSWTKLFGIDITVYKRWGGLQYQKLIPNFVKIFQLLKMVKGNTGQTT